MSIAMKEQHCSEEINPLIVVPSGYLYSPTIKLKHFLLVPN